MDAEYARAYRELYQRHWWWRAREALVLRTLRGLREGRARAPILDVGCGDGLFFDRLAEFGEVDGVEPDASLLTPDSPHRGRITVAPFDERFQPARRYALVLMLDVLEHLGDAEGALRHARSLLQPDGRLLVTVPAFPWLWTHHDDLNRHYTRYTRSTLRNVAALAGLRVEESRYFFHWTVAAKLAVRAKERVLGPGGPERLPAAPLNRALYLLSRAEQALHLPFGSSLLAVLAPE
jgi:2-polyprenyl-3-methyl-5-hydroxy-6-metoxy-1,4-benzoquinol methylase